MNRMTIIKSVTFPSQYAVQSYEYDDVFYVRVVAPDARTLRVGQYLTYETADDAFADMVADVKEYL